MRKSMHAILCSLSLCLASFGYAFAQDSRIDDLEAIAANHQARLATLEAAAATLRNYQGIVVGIATAGDTPAMCDYLDAGDGQQLQAALNAANTAGKDVWVRPGVIQLNNGPISIPANAVVRFSGRTTIRPGATDRRAVICEMRAKVTDMYVEVNAPAPGATGATLIEIDTMVSLDYLLVSMPYEVNLNNMTNESLRYIVKDRENASWTNLNAPFMFLTTFEVMGLPQSLTGISVSGANATVRSPFIIRGDTAIETYGNAMITDFTITSTKRRGILAHGTTAESFAVKIYNGFIKMNPEYEPCAAVEITGGPFYRGVVGASVRNVNAFLANHSLTESWGILLSGSGRGASVFGCVIEEFPVGIEAESTQTHMLVSGNTVYSVTPSISVPGASSIVNDNMLVPFP